MAPSLMLRGVPSVLAVMAILAASPCALAQPGNDVCGANRAAYTLPGIGGSVNGTFFNATRDGSACAGTGGPDVYYYFTPSGAGPWRLSLCTTLATSLDTVLSIHTNSCPVSDQNYATPQNALQSCNDDGSGCAANLSQIDSVPLTPGTSYIIRVARFSAGTLGDFVLQVINLSSSGACCYPSGQCILKSISLCSGSSVFLGEGSGCSPNPCPQPPPNDGCANAVVLQGASADVTGTTIRATTDGSSACGSTGSRDVWYAFIPSASGGYSFSLCQSSAAWDSLVSVHTFCPGNFDNQLVGACDDDGCLPAGQVGGHALTGQVNLAAGTAYLVRVAGHGAAAANSGDFRLTITPGPGACCAADGACSVTPAAACPAPGPFFPGASCSPSPCPVSDGACCRGSTCVVTPPSSCVGVNTAFAGPGAACNAYPTTTGSCCLADFNHVGGLSIQDLFDFLAGYFAGDPGADINRSGAISVEDIFNFLEAYFRGGC